MDASPEVRYPEGTEVFDTPDVLIERPIDTFWWWANRQAESALRLCRFAGLIAAFFLCFIATGHAQEVGIGVLCDTETEAEIFLAFAENGDPQKALAEVNEQVNKPTACALVQSAYFKGDSVKTIPVKAGIAQIIKVAVIGISDGMRFVTVEPMLQYAIFLEKSEAI